MNTKKYIVSIIIFTLSLTGAIFGQEIEINKLDLIGKIAYVSDDHNVYTIDLTTSETFQLSSDGTRRASYEFPTWSRDGQLAYFCCSVRGLTSPRLTIYISSNGQSEGEVIYNQDGERHVYANWSPKTCVEDNCVDLAVLIQKFSRSLLSVELFNSQNIDDGQRELGEGTPFYYSWSPTGDRLLIHRNNRLLQYYSVSSANIDSAFQGDLGNFLSPGWSPVDDRILFVVDNADSTELTILDGEKEIQLASDVEGILSFSWSPDGRYVAYRVATDKSISSLYVVDALTGEVVARSNISSVLAFFWSPDSQKIAYITLANPPGTFDIKNVTGGDVAQNIQLTDGFAWNILQVEDSANLLLSNFIPTLSMQYILTNFDQFAQSHSIWSPDSKYIVYSERESVDAGDSLITILDVNDPNVLPLTIAKGSIGIWSYK